MALVLCTGAILTSFAGDHGAVTLDARLRLETADMDGVDDADALTLRLRLGYQTPTWNGLSAMVEGEFTGVADRDAYNAAGVHGDPGRAVIADPESAQLDQLYVAYRDEGVQTLLGRQRIVLDNARFVGDVGWRQNRQTFDAATLTYTGLDGLELFYGYLENVVRIFGSKAPSEGGNAGEADSDSHLANLSYRVGEAATFTAYAYLLDLEDVPPTSSVDSYGASLTGRLPIENLALGYRLEYAYQEDAGDNPLAYHADYYHAQGNGKYQGILAEIGYEALGADNTGTVGDDGAPIYASFQTPLATLHQFNGFADRFLSTPPTGLEDFYVALGYELPASGPLGPVLAKVIYHDFESAEGNTDLGDEWDALLVVPLKTDTVPGAFKAIAKYAAYSRGEVGADTSRLTLELNYAVSF